MHCKNCQTASIWRTPLGRSVYKMCEEQKRVSSKSPFWVELPSFDACDPRAGIRRRATLSVFASTLRFTRQPIQHAFIGAC